MKKELVNEHLIHILEKTTPYQRMAWLKRSLDFWQRVIKQKDYPVSQKQPLLGRSPKG